MMGHETGKWGRPDGFYVDNRIHFDGNGHKITLAINTEANDTSYIGLFKSCDSCVFENLTVDGYIKVTVKDIHAYIGGIVGFMPRGTIVNCTNRAFISVNHVSESSGGAFVGGILGVASIGWVYDGIAGAVYIRNCQNYGNITQSSSSSVGSVGSVVGSLSYMTNWEFNHNNPILSNCRNYGFISGVGSIGGIVGSASIFYASASTAAIITISDCLNVGVVSGNRYVGCIVGELYEDNNSKGKIIIENCHFDKQMCPHDGVGYVEEY